MTKDEKIKKLENSLKWWREQAMWWAMHSDWLRDHLELMREFYSVPISQRLNTKEKRKNTIGLHVIAGGKQKDALRASKSNDLG